MPSARTSSAVRTSIRLRQRPGGVVLVVGEATDADLGDAPPGQAVGDQAADRAAVAGAVVEGSAVVMGVERDQPPAFAEPAVGGARHRRSGQRVVAAKNGDHRGALEGVRHGGLDAPVRRRRVRVGVVTLDVAEVDHAQVLELDVVVAVPGREALQGGTNRRRCRVRAGQADRGAVDGRAQHGEVGQPLRGAAGEPLARVQSATPAAPGAMGMRTSRAAAAAQASS